MNAAAYTRMLKQLLPPGAVWNLESDSSITKFMQAIADELVRIDGRAEDLVAEWDPRTATETIAEWEEFVGLPDERVTEISTDLEERRLAVAQKVVSQHGQNNEFFETLCAACGYTATVYNYVKNNKIFRSGSRCGNPVKGVAWCYAMRIDVSDIADSALAQDDFERVVRAATHSHIVVGFDYP